MPDRSPPQFDVFLSYHSRDREPVERIARSLCEQGLKPFLDQWYLVPGRPWSQALENALASCRAVAVCIGPGEMGPWQTRESSSALDRQGRDTDFPVIPVLLPGSDPVLGFLGQNTWVDLRQGIDDPFLLSLLAGAIRGEAPGPELDERIRATHAILCPYRGLLYFREEDAPFFFGRETAIAQLISAVRQHNLVAVVGASGSGKSSVVRAGLVPELRKARDHAWDVATIVPTDRPVHALAAVLMPFLEPSMTETDRLVETNKLAEALLSQTIKLREVVDCVLAKQPSMDRLLLIADQWEELFTLCKDDGARQCFIDNILEATATTKLSAVLTLRGDFFGRAITDYRPLSDRVQGAQVNLGPMTPAELRLAIEEPARKVALTFEDHLVDLILAHSEYEPGNLPLVEFVLSLLWEQRRGGELHYEAYQAMGQLKGAIAAKAESLYGHLSKQDQQRVQQIFLRLVRPGEGEADTRRRATFTELGKELRGPAQTLVDNRILVSSRLASSGEDTIEVSHEALIRQWGRLKKWVDGERTFIAWQQDLCETLRQYEKSKHSSDLLLRGRSLTDALDWLQKKPEYFSLREEHFIKASQNRKIRQRVAAAIVTCLMLLVIGGTTWLWQKGYNLDQAALKIQSVFVSIHVLPQMVLVPGGSFQMGDVEKLGESWRNPAHEVLVKPYMMGKYEVTFEEYDRFAIATGRDFPNDQKWGRGRRPVINVSWEDAKAYVEWLSQETGPRYRLLTESEWEYATRSGPKQEGWAGTSKDAQLGEYAVFIENSGNRTAEVGTKLANGFGVYDLSGNVWEWVEDCAHDSYEQAPTDGSVWLETAGGNCGRRILRGGSWSYAPEDLRASNRLRDFAVNRFSSAIGFRLAQNMDP